MLVKECPRPSGYGSSINFIDSNDVFAGFDMDQCCCENFGWNVTDTVNNKVVFTDGFDDLEDCNKLLDGYTFTKEFIVHDAPENTDGEGGSLEMFMSNKEGKMLSLFFFNYHNGYYSHGFGFKDKEKVITEGYL